MAPMSVSNLLEALFLHPLSPLFETTKICSAAI